MKKWRVWRPWYNFQLAIMVYLKLKALFLSVWYCTALLKKALSYDIIILVIKFRPQRGTVACVYYSQVNYLYLIIIYLQFQFGTFIGANKAISITLSLLPLNIHIVTGQISSHIYPVRTSTH